VFKFSPPFNFFYGTLVAQVIPALVDYPDRIGAPMNFKVIVLKPVVPVIKNQVYVVQMQPLEIEY